MTSQLPFAVQIRGEGRRLVTIARFASFINASQFGRMIGGEYHIVEDHDGIVR